MSLWYPYASKSVGAIGRGYAATLDELTADRRGRGGGLWGDFIVKTEQKQCSWRTVRPRVRRRPRSQLAFDDKSRPLESPLPTPRPPIALGCAPHWQVRFMRRARAGGGTIFPLLTLREIYLSGRPARVSVSRDCDA